MTADSTEVFPIVLGTGVLAFVGGYATGFFSAFRTASRASRNRPTPSPAPVRHPPPPPVTPSVRNYARVATVATVGTSAIVCVIAQQGPQLVQKAVKRSAVIGTLTAVVATTGIYRLCLNRIRQKERSVNYDAPDLLREKWRSFLFSLEHGVITGGSVGFISFLIAMYLLLTPNGDAGVVVGPPGGRPIPTREAGAIAEGWSAPSGEGASRRSVFG
eukprot:TRINITY_DN12488_c0_g1_i1.p1 TRINITY_DN12488_c0_g1~~TRINITY_DN12488_c0_g1_i1.p1  ORF type:complete len:216 (-),score=15.85 TRINITY_DN12488_c0_g1_i1:124-771(-)